MIQSLNEINKVAFSLARTHVGERCSSTACVLDNGCDGARAELTPLMLDENWRVFGLEIDFAEVLEKRTHFSYRDNLRVVCADSHSLPFRSKAFDLAIMVEVLEHLKAPAVALREVHRCLSDTGRLIFSVPNGCGLWTIATEYVYPLARKMFGKRPLAKGYLAHVSLLGLHELTRILQSEHFCTEQIISTMGIGCVRTLEAIIVKVRSVLTGSREDEVPRTLPRVLFDLEKKLSWLVPLRLHSDWVFVVSKAGHW